MSTGSGSTGQLHKKAPAGSRGFCATCEAMRDGTSFSVALVAIGYTNKNATICEALVTQQSVLVDAPLLNL